MIFNVNFLLYNLELIRVLSVRSKLTLFENFTLDNIRKNFTDSKDQYIELLKNIFILLFTLPNISF